ncbi:MAG: phosphoenolpyruvate carboxykinase (ATP) [Cyclobacteriaceae bacterium]|nr:phosphoenolpyruvate carboxykinase (ATP) [Cyclobacteriaceae bacterium]
MKETGIKPPHFSLASLGLTDVHAYWNASPEWLEQQTIALGQGIRTSTGALAIRTGTFTGRSPKDKFTVKDAITENTVWWNQFNIPFEPARVEPLYNKMIAYLNGKDCYVRDVFACADPRYRLAVRIITEYPWSNLFAYNMFLRPGAVELVNFHAEWTILCVPGFKADPTIDGTRQPNFSILDFTRKLILIGGSAYTGEIKKGVFTALNFILPAQKNVFAMHCSANKGPAGDTAIFFGLSGTGKTTLSADPNRQLIGDDEHGWTPDNTIFNFEGGCYAKTIDLSAEKEPDIFNAIRSGALLENVGFEPNSNEVNYADSAITENTRVSYPIHHIANVAVPSLGTNPRNLFFLTCDAYGVLPPISQLTPGQAAYHFISGYTARVAGTELGVTEPTMTFSTCFGAPFMPLHPAAYARMLMDKMKTTGVKVWLVNTGWSGGPYGTGKRMSLRHTRALITAALEGKLNQVEFTSHPIFRMQVPLSCPGVPAEILDPRSTWPNARAYDERATFLAAAFNKNFQQFAAGADDEIRAGAPIMS